MKKLILMGSALLLMPFLFSNVLIAQTSGSNGIDHVVLEEPEGPSINPGGIGACFPSNDKCRLTDLSIAIKVANYDQYVWPNGPGNVIVPTSPPNIYLQYSFGDYTFDPVLLNNFQHHHGVEYVHNYAFPPIPVNSSCYLADPATNRISIPYTIRLLEKLTSGGYANYPIHSYNGPGELFDCTVFNQGLIDHICCPNDDECALTPWINEGEIKVCCHECNNGFQRNSGSSNPYADSKHGLQWEIAPNPFSTDLKVGFSISEKSEIEIEIFNLNGKKLIHHNEKQGAGQHYINLDTSALPDGIYYCQIKTIDGIATQKIIKAN